MYPWEDTHSTTGGLLCPDAWGDDFGWGVGKSDGCILPMQRVGTGKLSPQTFGRAARHIPCNGSAGGLSYATSEREIPGAAQAQWQDPLPCAGVPW
jgi:hypothetical protein